MSLHNRCVLTRSHSADTHIHHLVTEEPSAFNRPIKNLVKYSFYSLHHLTQLNLCAHPVSCAQSVNPVSTLPR